MSEMVEVRVPVFERVRTRWWKTGGKVGEDLRMSFREKEEGVMKVEATGCALAFAPSRTTHIIAISCS